MRLQSLHAESWRAGADLKREKVNPEAAIRWDLAKRAYRVGAEWLQARQHFQHFPPIFIIGAQRSGTTLSLRVLGSQPPLCPVFEPRIVMHCRACGDTPAAVDGGSLPKASGGIITCCGAVIALC